MTSMKSLALAAILALSGANGAQAAIELDGEYVPMDAGAPGEFTNSWTLGNADFLAAGTTAGAKGDDFGDYFLFDVPDAEYVSFGLATELNRGPEISFSGWALFDYADSAEIDGQAALISNALESGPYLLASGTYELDVFGTFLKAGGAYDGYILGSPVPEPGGAAMLLAGLAAAAALARRRKAAA
jgi:hypothetical protein